MHIRLIILSLLISALVNAQEITGIPYSEEEMITDGIASDWSSFSFTSFPLKSGDNTGTDSIRTAFAWDEQYLYGFYMLPDKHLTKSERGNNNPKLNWGDAIEFYIDPQNDSKDRMDINDYQFVIDAGGEFVILKGESGLIKDFSNSAPKEAGIATVAFRWAAARQGTLNQNNDIDSSWCAEFAIPWAAIGVEIKTGWKFRIDVCADDLDSLCDISALPDTVEIPQYSYSSWTGYNDFSFPDHWKVCETKGSASWFTSVSRKYSKSWLMLFAITILLSFFIILLLLIRINKLKNIPVKAEIVQSSLATAVDPAPKIENASPVEDNPAEDPVFSRLREFVLSRIDKDLSPEDLAAETGMSLRNLQRLFKEKLQSPPSTFIVLIKIEKAASIIKEGKLNISEASYAVGFSDPAYFSRVFKKYFGISPKEFAAKEHS